MHSLDKLFQNVPWGSSNISLTIREPVKKMRSKIITFTFILILFLLPTTHLLKAEETDPAPEENSIDPAIMSMIKTQAMQREQEMLGLFGDGPFSTDIENNLQNAQQAMEQAQNFEETNTQAAAQQYLRAMKQYRNALRKHLKENPELLDEFEEPTDTETASEEIMESATQEEIEAAKTQLLNRFQERYRKQIQAMIENVEELEDDMSPQDAEKARQAFMHTLEKALRIQERIQSGECDEAIDDLEEASESLDEEFNELEDQDTAMMMRSLNKLESRIQKMIQVRARKGALGEDTSIEDDVLEEIWGNKNEMKQGYKADKGNGSGQGNQGSQGKGKN
jgi:hypothetical protein